MRDFWSHHFVDRQGCGAKPLQLTCRRTGLRMYEWDRAHVNGKCGFGCSPVLLALSCSGSHVNSYVLLTCQTTVDHCIWLQYPLLYSVIKLTPPSEEYTISASDHTSQSFRTSVTPRSRCPPLYYEAQGIRSPALIPRDNTAERKGIDSMK